MRVAVALDHLRANGRGTQSQPLANFLFELRFQVSKRAYRARKLAYPHLLSGAFEAGDVALHFVVPVSQLQAKGGGLGVNAMCAADNGRVLEFVGAAL